MGKTVLGLLVLSMVLVGCSRGQSEGEATTTAGPVTTSESVQTTTATAATTPPLETTTTLDAAEAEWEAITPWTGGPPGDYRTANFGTPFRFTTSETWDNFCSEGPTIVDLGPSPDATDLGFGVMDLEIATIEESVAFLTEGIQPEPEPETVEVGGAEGVRLEFTSNLPEIREFFTVEGSCGYALFPDERSIFWIVDVNGKPVTLAAFAGAGSDAETYFGQVQAVVDSIAWKDLG